MYSQAQIRPTGHTQVKATGGRRSYYAFWQQAAERLIAKKSLVSSSEFDQRAEEFLSGKRTPPHTHGGGLLSRDPGGGAATETIEH